MEIRLDCGEWHINDCIIHGDTEVGYFVYAEDDLENENLLFSSKNFEECLTWCYNS